MAQLPRKGEIVFMAGYKLKVQMVTYLHDGRVQVVAR